MIRELIGASLELSVGQTVVLKNDGDVLRLLPGPFREELVYTLAFRVVGLPIVELNQQSALLIGAHDIQSCDWRFRVCADTLEQGPELLRQAVDILSAEKAGIVVKLRDQKTPSLYAGEFQLEPVKTAVLLLNGKYRVALGILRLRILEFKSYRKETAWLDFGIQSRKLFKVEILLPFNGFSRRSISPFQNFTEPKLLFEPELNRQSLRKQAQRFLQPFVSTPIARQADHKV